MPENDLMSTYIAAVDRIEELERAIEAADVMLAAAKCAPESWVGQASRVLRKALDG